MPYKKIFILSFLFVFLIFIYYLKNPPVPKAIINGNTIFLEIAASTAEKQKGLGYRKSIPENKGMLFIYDHYELFGFWMKGMNFPLDFVWIADNKVVDLTEKVPIYSNNKITTLQPKVPVNRILELKSGSISKYNIKIGDTITFITK